jgi:hypothetical protein
MACYEYTITNRGNDKAFGEYVKASTGQIMAWYCPPKQTIKLTDVEEGSIQGDDAGYFYGYVAVYKWRPCGEPPASTCTINIVGVATTANSAQRNQTPNGAAEIEINEDPVEYEFSIGGQFWQPSPVFGGLANGTHTAYVRRRSDPNCYDTQEFVIAAPIPFLFATTKVLKNASKAGASDGEIQVSVISGSGNYTVHFAPINSTVNLDSGQISQTMVKVGLAAGSYIITVTDIANGSTLAINEKITEPVVVPETPGGLLEVPFMNSIQYVVEDLSVPQTPENRLFNNQFFPGFQPTNYLQKIVKTRALATQFNSDYKYARAELYDYNTDERVKIFAVPTLKEENIGRTSDHPLQLTAHNVNGFTRVYFASGAPTVPFNVGQSFEILNNADGFNGVYTPVGVYLDPNRGYEYAVISASWTLPVGTTFTTATGRFIDSAVNYNVYEIMHTFNDVPNGCYYILLTAFDSRSHLVARSEPLDIQDVHTDCNMVEYRNIDNAFGIAFSTGYTGVLWIPSLLGHKRRPGGERTTSRNSDYSLVKVSAKKQRIFDFETFMLPPYMHEKLSVVFDCDYWTINGVEYQAQEGYADPAYIYKSLLANSSIRIEQSQWLDKYNSDDYETVGDGGFIAANGGLIRK